MNNNPVNKLERKLLIIVAAIVVIGALFFSLVNFIANFLWFREMGRMITIIRLRHKMTEERSKSL